MYIALNIVVFVSLVLNLNYKLQFGYFSLYVFYLLFKCNF